MSVEKETPGAGTSGVVTQTESKSSSFTLTRDAGVVNFAPRRQRAEKVLGSIQWQAANFGYCVCPGHQKHTTAEGPRDCRVNLDGIPTVYCFHQHCADDVAAATRELRAEILGLETSADGHIFVIVDAAETDQQRREEQKRRLRLAREARTWLPRILATHSWRVDHIQAESPTPIPKLPEEHWRFHLGLFQPSDVVWIGRNVRETGQRWHVYRFREVGNWLRSLSVPGSFICPSTFKVLTFSRQKKNVQDRRFLVVESDIFDKDQMGAVLKWLTSQATLRAVIDTGGKSLHGWFDFPEFELFERWSTVLPAIGCDRALFNPAQPCRLGGALRGEVYQRLLWLNLDGNCDARES
jgi:hypothetical protein